MESIFESVGKNISYELCKKNMTQQSLADILGISKQVLSKIIKGKKAINIAELSKIAKALSISINTLMNVDLNENVQTPQFSFMGKIKNEETRDKFDKLRNIIEEILYLEDYANEAGLIQQ
jgi:transcriptional regulator with XRE-family HTH domain